MKKYVFTVLSTAVILFSVLLADYSINKDFAVVQTMQVKGETVKRYVSASGTVYAADKRDIYAKLPFKMGQINVSVGDKVKTGQRLAYLDKNTFLNELNLAILQKNSQFSSAGGYPDLESMRQEVEATETEVLSPIDGIVTAVNCYENGRISTDLPIFSVSDLDHFYISAKVSENKAKDIFQNQTVLIQAAGLNREYEGMVESISPTMESGQMLKAEAPSVEVKVMLKQTSEEMKPGMTAELKFLTTVRANAVVVPFDAVLEDGDGQYVYLNRSGYAKKQYVTLGEEFETRVEVLRGISPEDKLILEPRQNNITHGKKIDEIPGEENHES